MCGQGALRQIHIKNIIKNDRENAMPSVWLKMTPSTWCAVSKTSPVFSAHEKIIERSNMEAKPPTASQRIPPADRLAVVACLCCARIPCAVLSVRRHTLYRLALVFTPAWTRAPSGGCGSIKTPRSGRWSKSGASRARRPAGHSLKPQTQAAQAAVDLAVFRGVDLDRGKAGLLDGG